MEKYQKEIRKKRFSASRIYELCMGGSGASKMNYIFDLALQALDYGRDITTKEMEHGIISQADCHNAANLIFELDCVWHDEAIIHSNDKLLASPDALGLGFVVDFKCPYYIHTYIQQTESLLKKYHYQVITQMMCANCEKGYLITYLTKPEEYGVQWMEYPFPLEERIHKHDVLFNDNIANEILKAVEDNYHFIDIGIEKLNSAIEVNESQFFYLQFKEKCSFVELKKIAWWSTKKEIIRLPTNNPKEPYKFYVEKSTK